MNRFCIQPRHVGEPRGRAYPVRLAHPNMFPDGPLSSEVGLWFQGRNIARVVELTTEVVEKGDGRCTVDGETLWISLPNEIDPRTLTEPLILEVSTGDLPAEVCGTQVCHEMEPLLILGVQRSGTSALQVALDQTTRFKAPKDINYHPLNTLEGFYFRHVFAPYLKHPHLSPLGQHLDPSYSYLNYHRWNTGVFTDSGIAPLLLSQAASHVASTFSWLANGASSWVDKSPGWDSSLVAPLFAALYPKGGVVFLSRPPVENVLSIARLESTLAPDLSTERAVVDYSRNAVIWNVGHYLWRHFAKNLMPATSYLEIPFVSMRAGDQETLARLTSFLELTSAEAEDFVNYLPSVPLPRHPVAPDALDERVRAAIDLLCSIEARHWGYEPQVPASSLDPAMSDKLIETGRATTVELLTWLGLAAGVAQRIADYLIDPRPMPEGSTEDPMKVEPVEPGAILANLLEGGTRSTSKAPSVS